MAFMRAPPCRQHSRSCDEALGNASARLREPISRKVYRLGRLHLDGVVGMHQLSQGGVVVLDDLGRWGPPIPSGVAVLHHSDIVAEADGCPACRVYAR